MPSFPPVAMALTVLTAASCVHTHAEAPAQRASVEEQRASASPDSSGAVRAFVQEFYNRYLDTSFASASMLHRLDGSVDADLIRGLRDDSAAMMQTRDTRATLSFDPFLESTDPYPHYTVVGVRRDGQTYKVTMRPVCPRDSCFQTQTPVVEVTREGNRWMITNMFYDYYAGKDLKSLLCEWAKADLIVEHRPGKC